MNDITAVFFDGFFGHKYQVSFQLGLEHQKFNIFLSGKFNGEFRTLAGQGEVPENELVKSNFIFDVARKYFLSKNVSLMVNIMNLFDAEYAVSRVPAGLRPGMPFAVSAGFWHSFKSS
jgi:Fe(3+) dicitrate transport protein